MAQAQLVDQFDRPIRKAELTREIAAPTLAGVRNIWTGSIASGLTPQRLAAPPGVQRAAMELTGDEQPILEIFLWRTPE